MERIFLMCIKLFYLLPYFLFHLHKLCDIEKYDEPTRYAFLRHIATKANRAGRITVQAFGLENLPPKNGYILFPNHQGLFDALAFLQTHKRPFSVVMKKEVQRVSLLRKVIILLQAQLIDRKDVKQAFTVIRTMAKEVAEGRNYIIFAEGTRSKSSNRLSEFKSGSFKSAILAKCPIVPVALIDSFQAFDTHSVKKLTVQIHYLKPLFYEDYKTMKSVEIAAEVARRIQATLDQYTPIESKRIL